MDPRMIYKIGKQELMKSPCVGECGGCSKQFKPTPYEGKTFCLAYPMPSVKWTGFNIEGKPKTCPFMKKPEKEGEVKINPLKASKRGIKQASQVVVAATGSKESGKKKTERRDFR